MAEPSHESSASAFGEISPEEIEEVRIALRERKRGLEINQQALFRYTASLPPSRRIAVAIAGWGPIVLFPLAPVMYFIDWKFALLTVFLGIFWAGMGRKVVQAILRTQCREDAAFLKLALSVGLVRLE